MKQSPIIASILLLVLAGGARADTQETNSGSGLDLASFQIVARKNIFDATRRGGMSSRPPRTHVIQTISLLGLTDDFGQGEAFFGGNGAPDHLLKKGDSIDGFKISQITLDSVQLTSPTNTVVLKRDGSSTLRREDNGPWVVSDEPPPPEAKPADSTDSETSATTPSAPGESSGQESDVLKRLRLKREQEDK